MLLVCIRNYLKPALRYTFLILDTCHPYILRLRIQGSEDPWIFFEANGVRQQKSFENTVLLYSLHITGARIANSTKHSPSG
jgi:hypothetical protein